MGTLISAPDLDPFALISKADYGIVRARFRLPKVAECNNAARKAKSGPTGRHLAVRVRRSSLL